MFKSAIQDLQQAELDTKHNQEESQSTQQTDSNEANQNTQGVRGGDPVTGKHSRPPACWK